MLQDEDIKIHKKMAINFNNQAWDIIEVEKPTVEDLEKLIHLSHAAYHHWSLVGKPINLARAEYLISKAYYAANKNEEGFYWAKKYWKKINEVSDHEAWDKVLGLEIMARSFYITGDLEKYQQYEKMFEDEFKLLTDGDEKSLCRGEWDRGPWKN